MLKVVLLPCFYYLSKTLYKKIANAGKDIQWIFFDAGDPRFYKYNKKKHAVAEIKEYAKYIEIDSKFTELLFSTKGRLKVFKIYKEYKKAIIEKLEEINPDAIVSVSDHGNFSTRLVNKWCNANGKPFIIMQPAFLSFTKPKRRWLYRLRYLLYNKVLGLPVSYRQPWNGLEYKSNHVLFWGKFFENQYKKYLNKIPHNSYITGFPSFDHIKIEKTNQSKKFEDRLNISIGNRKVILICTQDMERWFGPESNDKINDIYYKAIQKNPDDFFILKIHPRESSEYYQRFYQKLSEDNFVLVQDYDIYELLQFADVHISISSFTSFEAVIYGIPIILLGFNTLAKVNTYETTMEVLKEIAYSANTAECLSEKIQELVSISDSEKYKKRRADFLSKRLYKLDDKSSERVIEIIKKLSENNS
ncbi:MAG: hypothetical protein FK730_13695 [Asgard group archaeon]|nr:hypothetical protein [Asgard group archaeon]